MSLNQSFISDFSEYKHTDLKGPKIKYKLHMSIFLLFDYINENVP